LAAESLTDGGRQQAEGNQGDRHVELQDVRARWTVFFKVSKINFFQFFALDQITAVALSPGRPDEFA
jgi:hypothetical protein